MRAWDVLCGRRAYWARHLKGNIPLPFGAGSTGGAEGRITAGASQREDGFNLASFAGGERPAHFCCQNPSPKRRVTVNNLRHASKFACLSLAFTNCRIFRHHLRTTRRIFKVRNNTNNALALLMTVGGKRLAGIAPCCATNRKRVALCARARTMPRGEK